jgi:hypothetical protein
MHLATLGAVPTEAADGRSQAVARLSLSRALLHGTVAASC